jgi:hypothetical protein
MDSAQDNIDVMKVHKLTSFLHCSFILQTRVSVLMEPSSVFAYFLGSDKIHCLKSHNIIIFKNVFKRHIMKPDNETFKTYKSLKC